METKFTLTENHIKLLQRMYVHWEDFDYDGAPCIDIKRPYGNSTVWSDVAEIIGYELPEDYDDVTEEQISYLLSIHYETGTALQIVLCTKSFEPGVYQRSVAYNVRSWVKIG